MSANTIASTSVQPAAKKTGLSIRRKRKLKIHAAQIGFAVVMLGGWQLFATNKWLGVDPFTYGKPTLIWDSLYAYFTKGDQATEFGSYWLQIETTLREAGLGFLLGTAVGVVLGVLLGMNRFLAEVMDPYIKIFNSIPRIVLGEIFLVALGLGELPHLLLAAVLVFFVVFFNAFQGVREVDRNILANAKVLGAKRLAIVRHVILPSALTWIIASLHSAFGFALTGAIVGEVIGAQRGLGLVIATDQGKFDSNGVYATMLVIAVLALAAEWIITQVEHRLLSWRPPSPSETASI
ncbi:NitT/TauT family transport system permease protein [Catenulispora sp. GAS73]|uniref:ABC transporter permease n=1 Tax=Catenulispora sp. GAS73 TaxID=3156269 RepID=UPI003519729E